MRSHSGVAAKFFDCLGRGGINIQLISTSEIKIAVVINEAEADQAARLTHEAFGLARLGPIATPIGWRGASPCLRRAEARHPRHRLQADSYFVPLLTGYF